MVCLHSKKLQIDGESGLSLHARNGTGWGFEEKQPSQVRWVPRHSCSSRQPIELPLGTCPSNPLRSPFSQPQKYNQTPNPFFDQYFQTSASIPNAHPPQNLKPKSPRRDSLLRFWIDCRRNGRRLDPQESPSIHHTYCNLSWSATWIELKDDLIMKGMEISALTTYISAAQTEKNERRKPDNTFEHRKRETKHKTTLRKGGVWTTSDLHVKKCSSTRKPNKISSMLLNDFFTNFFPSQRETGSQGERLKP